MTISYAHCFEILFNLIRPSVLWTFTVLPQQSKIQGHHPSSDLIFKLKLLV
jgi:hypothetical protein